MKRTPLKRSQKPMKRTTLRRGTSTLKITPLRRRSIKKIKRDTKYFKLRAIYLSEHPHCEFHDCPFKAHDLHHKAGRNGENMFRHFMGVCRYHHEWIHGHTKEARELGYILDVSGRE